MCIIDLFARGTYIIYFILTELILYLEIMWDKLAFEQLNIKLGSEFESMNESLKKMSVLFRNLPIPEGNKNAILEKSLKVKSAWYACLVNSNIDVLLIPEYIESRQSRNILIKKETEQYFRSLENFRSQSNQSHSALYDCILYSEEEEPKSSFDLFSSQTPVTAKCPDQLSLIYAEWPEKLGSYSSLESVIYSFIDWHSFNQFSFSSQRQTVLWLNFQMWKLYGPLSQLLSIEQFLFHKWNKEIPDPVASVKEFFKFLDQEVESIQSELNEQYRRHISFSRQHSQQKIVSSFVFESGFAIDAVENLSIEAGLLVKEVLKKGYLMVYDFANEIEIQKSRPQINELIHAGILRVGKEHEEVCLLLNTALRNKKSNLYPYQNIKSIESILTVDDFIQQPFVKPIVPIEKLNAPVLSIAQVKEKRQKAFFG